jgi:hypothetical protein
MPSTIIRRLLAVLLACAVAIGVVSMLKEMAQQVTMPTGIDASNMDQVKQALERGEFPFASLALVLCGWLLAAYVGGRIASGVGKARLCTFAFALIFTGYIIHELTLLPHPTWMWIGGALAVPLLALGAAGEAITLRI